METPQLNVIQRAREPLCHNKHVYGERTSSFTEINSYDATYTVNYHTFIPRSISEFYVVFCCILFIVRLPCIIGTIIMVCRISEAIRTFVGCLQWRARMRPDEWCWLRAKIAHAHTHTETRAHHTHSIISYGGRPSTRTQQQQKWDIERIFGVRYTLIIAHSFVGYCTTMLCINNVWIARFVLYGTFVKLFIKKFSGFLCIQHSSGALFLFLCFCWHFWFEVFRPFSVVFSMAR